jgi:hypothetical protein
MRQIARRQDHCAKSFAASCLLGLACEQKRIMRNRDIMSKLTWIVSVLLCAGCVVSQPTADDKAATVGKPVESVEKTISENSSPTPVAGQATTVSRPITRPNPQPVKTGTPILPASSHTENVRVVKTDAAPERITQVKGQTSEAITSTSVVKREEVPANITIKGTPKEAKVEPNNKFLPSKLSQKSLVWTAGGIAVNRKKTKPKEKMRAPMTWKKRGKKAGYFSQ